jgi:hypothetical protein
MEEGSTVEESTAESNREAHNRDEITFPRAFRDELKRGDRFPLKALLVEEVIAGVGRNRELGKEDERGTRIGGGLDVGHDLGGIPETVGNRQVGAAAGHPNKAVVRALGKGGHRKQCRFSGELSIVGLHDSEFRRMVGQKGSR